MALNRRTFLPRQRIDAQVYLFGPSLGGLQIRLFSALVSRNRAIRF
jgi:hypothetical protein